MRDSALKLIDHDHVHRLVSPVGEELMRDSALKREPCPRWIRARSRGRRRAHARQRFETDLEAAVLLASLPPSEKSSCATAL